MKISTVCLHLAIITIILMTRSCESRPSPEPKPIFLLGATGIVPAIAIQGGLPTGLALLGLKTLGATAALAGAPTPEAESPGYEKYSKSFRPRKEKVRVNTKVNIISTFKERSRPINSLL